MTQEVIMDIRPDGTIGLEAKGFKGKECDSVLNELEQSLGNVINKKLKPEYHQKVRHGEKIQT